MGTYIQLPETITFKLGLDLILREHPSTTFICLSTTKITSKDRVISFRYHEIDSDSLNSFISSYISLEGRIVILCEASYHLKNYRLNCDSYVLGRFDVSLEDLSETVRFINQGNRIHPLDVLIHLSRHGFVLVDNSSRDEKKSSNHGMKFSKGENILIKLLIYGPERVHLSQYQDSLGCAHLSWADFQRLFGQHQLRVFNM